MTKKQKKEIAKKFAAMRSNVLMDNDDGTVYVGFDEGTGELYAGGATNAGIIREYVRPYDNDMTMDDNIANLQEYMLEKQAESEDI